MQKKLIALAVAAAFSAPAFADTTVYGVVDAALISASADGQKSDMIAVSGGLAASRLGVKSVEELNNGMKAVVVLEYGLNTQNNSAVGVTSGVGAAFTARQQMLAVAGDFGTFATGYLQTTGYDWATKFDPTSGSAVSPLQSMTKGTNYLIGSAALAARAQRAVAYISPNISGLTVAVNYSTDTGLVGSGAGNLTLPNTSVGTKVSAALVSATYDWNDLSVGGVYAKSSSPAGLEAFALTDMAVGASYDLKVVKLFATYQNTKNGTAGAVADKAMSFGAVAPVGPGAVAFSYAKSTVGASTAGSTTANVNGSGYTVAWLQGLSKVTTLYVAVEKISNGSNGKLYSVDTNLLGGAASNLTAGGSSTLIALGLNKKF